MTQVPVQVLVIDADDFIREALRTLLEDAGLAAATTTSPAHALEHLRAAAERMVVLFDAGMPRVSDGQVTALASIDDALLRRHEYICMTTSVALMHPDLRQALDSLAVPIIEKPFDLDDLLTAVRQAQERLRPQAG
jgi:DNA-binding NtrC family response regulator